MIIVKLGNKKRAVGVKNEKGAGVIPAANYIDHTDEVKYKGNEFAGCIFHTTYIAGTVPGGF